MLWITWKGTQYTEGYLGGREFIMNRKQSMEYQVDKKVFTRDDLLLALQPYLAAHHSRIADDGERYLVTLECKAPTGMPPSIAKFQNTLVEAAFVVAQSARTLPLRERLLDAALLPYRDR